MILVLLGFTSQNVLAAEQSPVSVETGGGESSNLNNTTTANKKVQLTNGDVQIEAEQLNYDDNNGNIKASGGVQLSSKGIEIETEQLTYDTKSGLVVASDGVKLTTNQASYQTNSLIYNLKNRNGSLAAFTGIINGGSRNYNITGKSMVITGDNAEMDGPTITRCPKSDPDYLFVANKIRYNGQFIDLYGATLYVKGIPVFYYPHHAFNMNEKAMPRFELGSDATDGLRFKVEYSTPIKDGTDWRYQGNLTSKNGSTIGFGVGSLNDNFTNHLDFLYDFRNFFGVADQLNYDTSLFNLEFDGSRDFSVNQKGQLGFTLTRKYWDGPLGRWQFGILGRKVGAYDDSKPKQEYGGIYGGYRIDFNPHPDVTLSLLQLKSFTHDSVYGDFMEDFQIGSNWLYDIKIPLNKEYSFGLNGDYNSDYYNPDYKLNHHWVHQIYQINRETCCFQFYLGWDFAVGASVSGLAFKF